MTHEAARSKVKAKRTSAAMTVAALLAFLAPLDANAQQLPLSPPMPPPRPVMPDEAPAARQPRDAQAPLAGAGVEAAPKDQAQPIPAASGEDAPHIAADVDRAALRACAIEWHRMTASGAAMGKVWRDFAPECLARQAKDAR